MATTGLSREQVRLVAKVAAVREKRGQLEAMLVACDAERDRALLLADDAGIAKAELARAYKVTPSSIIGYLKVARAAEAERKARRRPSSSPAAPLVVVAELDTDEVAE